MTNACTSCNGSGFTEVTYRFIKAELPCSECNQEEIAKLKAESERRLDAERVNKQAVHKWNEIIKPVYRDLYNYDFVEEAINRRRSIIDTRAQLEIAKASLEEAKRKYREEYEKTTSMHMLYFLSTELQNRLSCLRKESKSKEDVLADFGKLYEEAKALVEKIVNCGG